ncbi:MAG: OmpA family protein [Magnetococcales bacterium]|nr:OmpA family protein [Magnetococcales bacterium]
MMKIFRMAALATVGLLTLALTACTAPTVPEGWQYGGFKQWHPQAGKKTVGVAGTQCYFCERTEMDSDGDGVTDDKDQCPNTPKGFPVDARGCPLDSDGDGVVDGLDQCPGTPRGTQVDAKGCPVPLPPVDSDGDGVVDDADKCPGTPKGASVNHVGCWVLENLHFDIDKAVIKAVDFPLLDGVLGVLNKNPSMKVEIQGHTDTTGSRRYNQKLSEKRAEAVRAYLVGKGVAKARITTVGYGKDKPVADNVSPQGRAANRRVQLDPIK